MLPQKRKKNLKIDSSEKFVVFNIEELDPAYFEEFTLPPIDSGMEAEEEKEVHLKKVIETKAGEIPVPVIEEIDGYIYDDYNIPEKYCKYQTDVDLEYNRSVEDEELIDLLKMDENEYTEIVNQIKKEIDDNQRVSSDNMKYNNDKVYKKIYDALKFKFLLREECEECSSYVCFRKRILKPSRKNRRSETQAIEKITKLDTELIILIKMCEYTKDIHEIDGEIFKIDSEIATLVGECNNNRTKKKIKKILRSSTENKVNNSISRGDLFQNVLHNRDNIRVLKRKINTAISNLDEDVKKEWSAYQKYCQDRL